MELTIARHARRLACSGFRLPQVKRMHSQPMRPTRHYREVSTCSRVVQAVAQSSQQDVNADTDPEVDAQTQNSEGLMTFDQLLAEFKDAASAGPVDQQTADGFASSVEAEVSDLRSALDGSQIQATELEAQLAKLNDQFLRLNADFDNFRKRTASEKQSITVNTKGDIIQALLPVIDNFELAKSQLKVETEGEQKVDASYQGVYRQMVDIFRGIGLDVVPGEGASFDPEVHEAIMREESDEVPDGTVLQEFRRGFKLGDKLLRPAMVKVSFREEASSAVAAAEAAVNDSEKEEAAAS